MGTLKDMYRKALETDTSHHMGSLGDDGWGIPLPGTSKCQNLFYEGTMLTGEPGGMVHFNGDFRNSNRWLCKLSVTMGAL